MEREVEANNFEVSFSALRKDVVDVLDLMERLKNEEDQIAVDVADQIEKLKFWLALICTYVQLSYSDLEKFEHRMRLSRQKVEKLLRPILDDVGKNVECKYNTHHVLPSLMDKIDDCINSCHRSKSSATMTDEQLNFLLLNLHYLSKYLAEKTFPLVTLDIAKNEILQKCVAELVEDLFPQFQLMAERVGDSQQHVVGRAN